MKWGVLGAGWLVQTATGAAIHHGSGAQLYATGARDIARVITTVRENHGCSEGVAVQVVGSSDWFRGTDLGEGITRIEAPYVGDVVSANLWHIRGANGWLLPHRDSIRVARTVDSLL